MAEKQKKILVYMSALYGKMTESATTINNDSQGSLLIWQGRLIETCTSVGIPTGYYKRVVDAMKALGCIEMLNQGRRGANLTAIALRYPPTAELYEKAIVKSGANRLTAAPSFDMLAAQVEEIKQAIGGMHIPSALQHIDTQIKELQTAVHDLRQQVSNTNKSNTTQ